ncbi:MAG: response regulator [Nitrospirae bacterium]|nr:response regulator [Nitrospirota bacterium]
MPYDKGLRLLLVEDDAQDVDYLNEVLSCTQNHRFNLSLANTLKAAVDQIQAGDSFDVILLDLFLPDSRGIDTFIKLHLSARKMPIVVLSALDDEAIAIRAIKEGAQDYIIKWRTNSDVLARTMLYSIERNRLLVEIEDSCENRFFRIIENNADGIIIVDRNGYILFVNPALEAMFGRMAEELTGELFGFPMVAGETVEIDIVNKNPARLTAEMRVVELPWENETVYLASLRDVTERKKTEQMLYYSEKMASIGQLASGVAHEINNPLNNVLIIIHALRQKLQNSTLDGFIINKIELMKKNIERATTITKELLSFSRHKSPNMVDVDINDIIDSSLTLVSSRLNGIEVIKHMADGAYIKGDFMRFEQVFINILSNAAEAMPSGGRITLSTEHRNGFILAEITDTGTGILEEDMKHVFEPFFTTKESKTSIGLGLSICYGIVKDHGGSIEITSPHGKGTNVAIKLPKAQYDE